MEALRKKFSSFKRGAKEFHTKKPQLEFFTALLTIPVLLTVIILNLNNLRGNQNKSATPTPVVITQTAKDDEINQAQTTPTQGPCEPGIGEISIDSPEENENVSDNPVMVDINYKAGDFCAVVWSYRINNGRYSDYLM
ncbi:MAG: hypothetical protein HYV38_01325 [Candidatus Levybacteria bacterium]|nr:hypothetical protein [Candidatus Levybacteria bacterium]